MLTSVRPPHDSLCSSCFPSHAHLLLQPHPHPLLPNPRPEVPLIILHRRVPHLRWLRLHPSLLRPRPLELILNETSAVKKVTGYRSAKSLGTKMGSWGVEGEKGRGRGEGG